jgi:hypothetical protein
MYAWLNMVMAHKCSTKGGGGGWDVLGWPGEKMVEV